MPAVSQERVSQTAHTYFVSLLATGAQVRAELLGGRSDIALQYPADSLASEAGVKRRGLSLLLTILGEHFVAFAPDALWANPTALGPAAPCAAT